jgi:hypothetical protein
MTRIINVSQVGTRPESSGARVSAGVAPSLGVTVDESLVAASPGSTAASDDDAVALAEGESEGEPEGDSEPGAAVLDSVGSVVVEDSVGDAGVAELEPGRVLDGGVVGLAGSEVGPEVGLVVGFFVGWVVPDVVGDVGAGEVVVGSVVAVGAATGWTVGA